MQEGFYRTLSEPWVRKHSHREDGSPWPQAMTGAVGVTCNAVRRLPARWLSSALALNATDDTQTRNGEWNNERFSTLPGKISAPFRNARVG